MEKADMIALAKAEAAKLGLDSALVCAVFEQESSWNPWAVRYEPAFLSKYVGPIYVAGKITATEAYTRSMSWGLGQLMGQTARELGYSLDSLPELCDPEVGIPWFCLKLSKCMDRMKDDVPAALAAYNGGSNEAYPGEVMARMKNYTE